MPRRTLLPICCAMILGASLSAADQFNANDIRAAFIYKFRSYVSAPFVGDETICAVDSPDVHSALARLSVNDQSGHPQRVMQKNSGDDLAGCHVIYVPSINDSLVSRMRSVGAVTVSDQDDFLHKGGMIQLFVDGERLRFRISRTNALGAGVSIRSSLLALAAEVY